MTSPQGQRNFIASLEPRTGRGLTPGSAANLHRLRGLRPLQQSARRAPSWAPRCSYHQSLRAQSLQDAPRFLPLSRIPKAVDHLASVGILQDHRPVKAKVLEVTLAQLAACDRGEGDFPIELVSLHELPRPFHEATLLTGGRGSVGSSADSKLGQVVIQHAFQVVRNVPRADQKDSVAKDDEPVDRVYVCIFADLDGGHVAIEPLEVLSVECSQKGHDVHLSRSPGTTRGEF